MSSPRALLLLLLLLAASCSNPFDFLNPTVLDVLMVHVPDLGQEFGIGETGELVLVEVFLVQAGTEEDEEGGVVEDALVELVLPDGTTVELPSVGEGRYEAISTDVPALYYEQGATYRVSATIEGEAFEVAANAFQATEVLSPINGEEISAAEPLTVQVAAESDATVVIVYDESGEQVYHNLPGDADTLYDMVTDPDVTQQLIPAGTLADDHIYVVGAAAVEDADWVEFDDQLNSALSVFVSGGLDVAAVSTAPLEVMGGMVVTLPFDSLQEYGLEMDSETAATLYAGRVTVEGGIDMEPLVVDQATLSWSSGEVSLQPSDHNRRPGSGTALAVGIVGGLGPT